MVVLYRVPGPQVPRQLHLRKGQLSAGPRCSFHARDGPLRKSPKSNLGDDPRSCLADIGGAELKSLRRAVRHLCFATVGVPWARVMMTTAGSTHPPAPTPRSTPQGEVTGNTPKLLPLREPLRANMPHNHGLSNTNRRPRNHRLHCPRPYLGDVSCPQTHLHHAYHHHHPKARFPPASTLRGRRHRPRNAMRLTSTLSRPKIVASVTTLLASPCHSTVLAVSARGATTGITPLRTRLPRPRRERTDDSQS